MAVCNAATVRWQENRIIHIVIVSRHRHVNECNHGPMEKPQGGDSEHIEKPEPGHSARAGSQGSSPAETENEDIRRAKLVSGGERDQPIGRRELPESALETDSGASYIESYRGPLPHPAILRGYAQAGNDFPERIMRMAEIDLETRITIEKRSSLAEAVATVVGMIGFLVLVLFGVAGAFIGGVLMANPNAFWLLTLPALSGIPRVIEAVKGTPRNNAEE